MKFLSSTGKIKIMNLYQELKNKKILILGLGVEGFSTYQFLRRLFPTKVLGLADQQKSNLLNLASFKKDKYVKLYLGPNYLKKINSYNLVIKSPGIPMNKTIYSLIIRNKLTSQTKLFFKYCPSKIIGVTGTKGKGTTVTLIYHILNSIKKPVLLAGNIGTPMLPLLSKLKKNDLVILELSSHQLADLNKSPNIAVLLNLFVEHMDHFKNFANYVKAKTNIFKYQAKKDCLVYNTDDCLVAKISQKSPGRKISFSLKNHTADYWADQKNIFQGKSPIVPINLIPLIGRHNLYNVMAAISVAKLFKISNKTISQALSTYKPLPHRLELVGTFKEITFYNDSQATNPKAVIAGLQALPKTATLICGGYNRGGVSYEELSQDIVKRKNLKTLIFFPTTGQLIFKAIKKFSSNSPLIFKNRKYFFVDSMEKAVKLAYQHTPKGSVCLLSPASASFGIFKNYADRGDQFKKWVKVLA
jgi:UDP-N-acetylmuramoylalanine--D-glutamate ligase